MKKNIVCMLMACCLVLSACTVTYNENTSEIETTTPDILSTEETSQNKPELDSTLAKAIKKELGYSDDYQLTAADLENVTGLMIFEDEINSLKGVSLLTNLTELSISGGAITDISGLNGLKQLSCIDISGCSITEIPDLSDCPMLTSLYLPGNLIEDASMLNKIETLEYVDVSDNRITSIASIKDLKTLKGLAIDNNCILDYAVLADNNELIEAINYGSQGQYEQFIEVENKAKEIADTFPDNISDLELEKRIYQYIIDNMEFEVETKQMKAFGYYGLLDGTGVCGDYAEAFCLLARHAGLEAYVCSSETHAWNIVKIDGQYYHCDALWDEPEEEWKHFNLKEEVILELPDHTYNTERYPDCR